MMKHTLSWKQTLAGLLSALMLLSLAACGGQQTGDKDTTTASAETTAPAEDTTAGQSDVPVGDEKNPVLLVAPDGDDATGNPYQTLAGVRDAVRAMDKTGLESVTVLFRAGHYESCGTQFTAEDSGTDTCKITYAAYPGETVSITSGRVMPRSAFHAVEDEAILARLNPEAKDNILCASLSEIGWSVEDCQAYFAANRDNSRPAGVYANGIRQNLARYPDTGYLRTRGLKKMEDGSERRFKITDEQAEHIKQWDTESQQIFLYGMWKYEWSSSTLPFEELQYDGTNYMVVMKSAHHYGLSKNREYYCYNILEELTVPGEWFIDWNSGMLYYYPDENWENVELTVSMNGDDIVKFNGTQNVNFENLIFEANQHSAMTGGDMRDMTFDHCIFRCVDDYGAWLKGNNLVFRTCEFTQIGASGMDIRGGDYENLIKSGNLIEDCYFHHYCQLKHEGYGIWLNTSIGDTVSHCEFCYAPQGGLTFYGNEFTIEYNEFHHLDGEADDAGVIYYERHFEYLNNVIRYNYFHDIRTDMYWARSNGEDSNEWYAPHYIYEDDECCGGVVYGNLIVADYDRPFENRMAGMDSYWNNNILIGTGGVLYYGYELYTAVGSTDWKDVYLGQSPFMNDVWKEKYPQLDKYRHGTMTEIPEDTNVEIKNNLFFVNYDVNGNTDSDMVRINQKAQAFVKTEGNICHGVDMLELYFVDPANKDFTLKPDAPIFAENPNFEPLPFAEMGRITK